MVYTKKELFAELKRVWKIFGRRPTYREFRVNSIVGISYFERTFKNWTLCIESFCLKNKSYNSTENGLKVNASKNLLLKDLNEIKKIHESQILSFSNYKSLGGKYSRNTFKSHFGNWQNAMQMIGLKSAKVKIVWTENQLLLDELQKIIAILGRNPLSYEIENLGKYPYQHYFKAFGGVNKSLIALEESIKTE